MKIRNGFVSNSSSSSFVCVIKNNDLIKFENDLTPVERLIYDETFTLVGKEVFDTTTVAALYSFVETSDFGYEVVQTLLHYLRNEHIDDRVWDDLRNHINCSKMEFLTIPLHQQDFMDKCFRIYQKKIVGKLKTYKGITGVVDES